MNTKDLLRECSRILEETPQIMAEAAVKKTLSPLEKAAQKLIQAAAPYREIDWPEFLELSAVLSTTRITKTNLAETNRRLAPLKVKLTAGTAKAKKEFALRCAQNGTAGAAATELKKDADTLQREELYRIAIARSPEKELEAYAEKDLKKLLKFRGIKEQKVRRGKRTVFDRAGSTKLLLEHLKEVRSRIQG